MHKFDQLRALLLRNHRLSDQRISEVCGAVLTAWSAYDILGEIQCLGGREELKIIRVCT
jgi:hypothetical protein